VKEEKQTEENRSWKKKSRRGKSKAREDGKRARDLEV
jgi:hypothetical protein